MALFTLALILTTLLITFGTAQNCPNGIKVRKSWGDLSWGERSQLGYCFRDAYSSGQLWRMCAKHRRMLEPGHSHPYFLPFHRCFLREMESILAQYGCDFGLPYWDSTLENENWWESSIWHVFGNLGGEVATTNNAECLREGWFAQMQDDRGVCLAHNSRKRPFYPPISIARWVNTANNFEEFRGFLEDAQHALVHSSIHYTMAYLSISACDPIFYLHHAAVDYYYTAFQQRSPEMYTSYPEDRFAPAPAFEEYGWSIDQCIRYREFDCVRYESPSNNPPGAIEIRKREDCVGGAEPSAPARSADASQGQVQVDQGQAQGPADPLGMPSPDPQTPSTDSPVTQPIVDEFGIEIPSEPAPKPAGPAPAPEATGSYVDTSSVPNLPLEEKRFHIPTAHVETPEPIQIPSPISLEACEMMNLNCTYVHQLQQAEAVFLTKVNRDKARYGKVPGDLLDYLRRHPVEPEHVVRQREVVIEDDEFVVDLSLEPDSDLEDDDDRGGEDDDEDDEDDEASCQATSPTSAPCRRKVVNIGFRTTEEED